MINFDEIPKCIINLPTRPERLKEVEEELPKFFNNTSYTLIKGVIDKTSKLGIAKAHMNCIEYAKNNNFPNILILEDDVIFRDGAREYADECMKNIPEDYDILLGGIYECGMLYPVNDLWNKTGWFCGLHFYIVNEKAYDKILAYGGETHIDKYMVKFANLTCYVAKKHFAIQRVGFSDNINAFADYSSLLQKFELL